MWNEQKTYLTSQLSPGELLLWSGQPKQGLVFHLSDIYSVFVLVFIAVWLTMVIKTGAPVFFLFFAVPGVLFAVYINTARYFVNSKQRAKTYYGVTNERVIIVSGLRSREVKSLPLKFITDITIDERSDGTGTIKFGPAEPTTGLLAKFFSRGEEVVNPSFDLIQDAKRVYEIVRNAQKNKT
jgi:hypothetical protein